MQCTRPSTNRLGSCASRTDAHPASASVSSRAPRRERLACVQVGHPAPVDFALTPDQLELQSRATGGTPSAAPAGLARRARLGGEGLPAPGPRWARGPALPARISLIPFESGLVGSEALTWASCQGRAGAAHAQNRGSSAMKATVRSLPGVVRPGPARNPSLSAISRGRTVGGPRLARPTLRRTAGREWAGRFAGSRQPRRAGGARSAGLEDRCRRGPGLRRRAEARNREHDQPEDCEGHHVAEAGPSLRGRRRTRWQPALRAPLPAIGHRVPRSLTAAGYAARDARDWYAGTGSRDIDEERKRGPGS